MHTSSPPGATELAEIESGLRRVDRSTERLEKSITAYCSREVSRGRRLGAPAPSRIDKLSRGYIQWRIGRSKPLWILLEQLEGQLEETVSKTTRLIQLLNRRRLQQALDRHRSEFTTFLKALRARTGGNQEDLFNTIDFKTLFKAFPVWLVNLSDIHEALPLNQELFDLAIIDEATQCDIAACLPVLQRAKRAVIVGDPNQLRHLSFLSTHRQRELIEKRQVPPHQQSMCDYRERSILDLVNENISGQDRVIFLDEHFRSAPPIIQFSNETFYGNALHIMTEKPGEPAASSLTLRNAGGQRRLDGANLVEARLVVQDVTRQVEREKPLGPDLSHSIGILSPFRSQVECIAKELSTALPPDAFTKHHILIGTAHTFQGEERDVMFLSLALDSSSHPASLRFLEKRDVFNVSITRARITQHVYISLNPSRLGRESLLGAYLSYVAGSASPSRNAEGLRKRPSDRFQAEVRQELERRGCQTWPAYSIAGLVMDIVTARNGRSCGIDLIGYPGDFAASMTLERYKMFHRAGLRVVPVPFSRWLADKNACLDAVDRSMTGGPQA